MTWAVVQTEALREQAVREFLKRTGRETYLPFVKNQIGRIVPLFPTYVLVGIANKWWDVRWAPHVIRILMAGDRPAELAEEIVASIRNRERNGLVKLPQAPRLKRGQQVRVVRGAFDGHIGVYAGMSGKDRERVLLELLGRQVRIELASSAVEPLDVVASGHRSRY